MRRFRSLFLALALTATLAGNIFATGGALPVAGLPTSAIAYVVGAVLSMAGLDEQCPLRQCTHCKPNTEADGDGDCRPTPN